MATVYSVTLRYGASINQTTGGFQLSHTAVKPDSHLTWIFCQKKFM